MDAWEVCTTILLYAVKGQHHYYGPKLPFNIYIFQLEWWFGFTATGLLQKDLCVLLKYSLSPSTQINAVVTNTRGC